jgi:hypothetical protein
MMLIMMHSDAMSFRTAGRIHRAFLTGLRYITCRYRSVRRPPTVNLPFFPKLSDEDVGTIVGTARGTVGT